MPNMQRYSKHFISLRSLVSDQLKTFNSSCRSVTTAALLTDSQALGACGAEPYSETFRTNQQFMSNLTTDLHSTVSHILEGGGLTAITRHHERNKMLPRERIKALLDPGSPFLELSQLAGYKLYGG